MQEKVTFIIYTFSLLFHRSENVYKGIFTLHRAGSGHAKDEVRYAFV